MSCRFSLYNFVYLRSTHWVGQKLQEIELPPDTLVVYRESGETISVPDGQTVLEAGDRLVLSANEPEQIKGVKLTEINVSGKHKYKGKRLADIPKESNNLIIMVKRGKNIIIPKGDTEITEGDVLICNQIAE